MNLKNFKKILINFFIRENYRNIFLEYLKIVLKFLKFFCVMFLDFEE